MYLKAYREYQQTNYDKCLETLKAFPSDDSKRLDLEAQIYVMKKEYKKAYEIYTKCEDPIFADLRKANLEVLRTCSKLDQPGAIDEIESIEFKEDLGIPSLNQNTSKKTKSRKKRKGPLPKQYDPVAGPDPERWLPRRDRKNVAHKLRKKRKGIKGRAK